MGGLGSSQLISSGWSPGGCPSECGVGTGSQIPTSLLQASGPSRGQRGNFYRLGLGGIEMRQLASSFSKLGAWGAGGLRIPRESGLMGLTEEICQGREGRRRWVLQAGSSHPPSFVSSQAWLPLPAPFLCPDSVSGHTGLTPCAGRHGCQPVPKTPSRGSDRVVWVAGVTSRAAQALV